MQPPGHSAGLITGTAFDFAKAAISANGIQLRRRLKIGRTDDPAEAEADHAAEKVVRMPEPVQSREGIAQKVTGRFQTSGHKEAQALQMERSETYADARQEAPSIIHEVLRSTGQPLGASTRHFMEPRFGHDFSQVRVHTDARAAESASAVGAHAYTVGKNVVFGRGEFAPTTSSGRRLIAHELAHVATTPSSSLQK